MNQNHCFYCSTRELNKICPLEGAEYLIKHQNQSHEDKFTNACAYETLIRHLKNAPRDYLCPGIKKCANLQKNASKGDPREGGRKRVNLSQDPFIR